MAERNARTTRTLTRDDDRASAPAQTPTPGKREPVEDVIELGSEEPRRSRWTRRSIGGAVALGLLLVASLVATVLFGQTWLANQSRDTDRADAIAAARHVALALATISYKSADDDIRRVVGSGTGEFAGEFEANLDSYVDVVRSGKITSTGEVREAGLISLAGDVAKVAVAIASTVKNKQAPKGEKRWYRMSVELQRQEDGRWLTSQVEFVQ